MAPSTPPGAEMTDAQVETLTRLIASENLPGAHLEVGTASGTTLAQMIGALPTPHVPAFVVVDNMRYFPDQMRVVRANLERHGVDPDQVEFRVGDSGDVFKAAARARDSFDFMVIDASHRIRKVTDDLRWTRLLRPGGLVCLHDYHPDFPGVMKSVDRFLTHYPNYERTKQVGGLLVLRKVGPSPRLEISAADRRWAAMWRVRFKITG
jgi:predicted O-methyltransferase YrrM